MSATSGLLVDFPQYFKELETSGHEFEPSVPPVSKKKKPKKRVESVGESAKTSNKLGTSRGIETLFRNSYRAQLDLIALAATKANMMISINGLIASVVLVSGGFVVGTGNLILIPIGLFFLTSLGSMMFAVLAVRPRREASKNTLSDFQSGQANLLIFEQFSCLSDREYRIGMKSLLQDNNRIYDSMAGQLYKLGCDADRKFKCLNLSYTIFLVGLAASALSLLLVAFNQPSAAQ